MLVVNSGMALTASVFGCQYGPEHNEVALGRGHDLRGIIARLGVRMLPPCATSRGPSFP